MEEAARPDVVLAQAAAQQGSGVDCGAYAMVYTEHLLRHPPSGTTKKLAKSAGARLS